MWRGRIFYSTQTSEIQKLNRVGLGVISGMVGLSVLFALSFDQTTKNQSVLFSQNEGEIQRELEEYFKNFKHLAKSESWEEIIVQGTAALEAAKKLGRYQDEARICAQLTSTAFYQGEFSQALEYAKRCHELSEAFEDPSLFVRALYLESAIFRVLASKNTGEAAATIFPQKAIVFQDFSLFAQAHYRAFVKKNAEEAAQQASYLRAVEIAEEAASIYSQKGIDDELLKGKIYFNLGAAHADNPRGDLDKAANCYRIAIECYKRTAATHDLLRTKTRLGKVYLLQEKYDSTQGIIDQVRPQVQNERLAMHVDYLEAQLKLAQNDIEAAIRIAKLTLRSSPDFL